MIERESPASRVVYGSLLSAIVIAFLVFTHAYHAAAHPGMDQNAYLVGGKMLAHLHASYQPAAGYEFVGRMWVAGPQGSYYPKYPLALPIVYALAWGIGGVTLAYAVSPICMALALVAVFLTARQVAGSFAGVLGTVMIGASPVTLALANNPNSHAASLCLTAWGMCLLLRWWERATTWRAALAGLLLGCAATVRYGDAVLVVPLLLVALFNVHWGRGRSWGQAATLLGCWLAPIALLLTFNRLAMGVWTGYDFTNESTGFAWANVAENWDVAVRQLANVGLFMTLPIGVIGLILLLARNWRLAAVLWAWALPGVLAYTAYYYAPETTAGAGVGYARFFLTTFPAFAVGAAWCTTRLAPPAGPYASWPVRVVAPVAAAVVVLGAAAYNVATAAPDLAVEQRKARAVALAAEAVIVEAKAPARSVVFGPTEPLNHLQFAGDYELYDTRDVLDPASVQKLKNVRASDGPGALQPARAKAVYDALRGEMSEREFESRMEFHLVKRAREIAAKALAEGRRVFVMVPAEAGGMPLRFTDPSRDSADGLRFTTRVAATWAEPAIGPARRAGAGGQGVKWELVEVVGGR